LPDKSWPGEVSLHVNKFTQESLELLLAVQSHHVDFCEVTDGLVWLQVSKKAQTQQSPTIFTVETVLGCNLKCPECAVGGDMITRPKGFMPLDRFKIIAEKIRPYCQHLYLHLWGEPLLNPDIIAIINYASRFTTTNISTNGMSLTPELAEALITSGVTEVIFSIDGMSQGTYERYRVGGDFSTALTAMKMLHYSNLRHGSKVSITPQFIVFKHNQHEIADFGSYCNFLGLTATFKAPYLRNNSQYQISDLEEYRRRTCPDQSSLYRAMCECRDPTDVCTILLDGSVVACCYDHNKATCFGNMFEQSVVEIWNSPQIVDFRNRLLTQDPPDFCQNNCLLYTMERTAPKPGRRSKKLIDVSNSEKALEYARTKCQVDGSPEGFDAYEQLVSAYPSMQNELLSEIYDQYQPLESQSRYQLYQSRFFDFCIQPDDKVLDVGSGHLPFPFATHLADIALDDDKIGRAGVPFRRLDGKPVYECSVENMPFADKEFDFVYCSHVLEHVSDPVKACKELMRVGRRGYIETPAPGKDMWLNTAAMSNHRWKVELDKDTLVFREYAPEDICGFNSNILLDMHCSPQTIREKAFSALINLRADLVNTMFYWENEFQVEVYRNKNTSTANSMVPSPINPVRPVAANAEGIKLCLFINTYYSAFLEGVYKKKPNLEIESYLVQKHFLHQESFGDSDFYSYWISQAGYPADDLIVNCKQLQTAWAKENGCCESGQHIVIEQIRYFQPAVVYIQDMNGASREFLQAIRSLVHMIVGQIATPIVNQLPLDCYDLVFSSFPHFITQFRLAGVKSYYQALAFDPRILERINAPDYQQRIIDCSFVGGISGLHMESYRLLEILAEKTPIEFWGYGVNTLPSNSLVRARHHGEAWGTEMFQVLGQSKITINRHGEIAEQYANNMRLFEATGCGALLITDYKDNLHELFEIGKEIVAYRSPEECAALVNYYLSNPDEALAIAQAGQARTLRDHTYALRMQQTAELLERHLRYQREQGHFKQPSRISDEYCAIDPAAITPTMKAAWQDSTIPLQQRALVQSELSSMYKGEVPITFSAIAEILRPVVAQWTTVLEIGCASGYYYEILEYLLGKRIAYTGVDYSQAMIEMAKDYYPAASFFCCDGANLFFASRRFQVVISSCVLLHCSNYREHIYETARVADHYIIAARTPVCRNRPTQYFKKCAYSVETVELLFNEGELLQEFALNNFKLLRSEVIESDPGNDRFCVTYLLTRS
jgi:ubiquinone/menaquinone biosynthesis C-methylase UbiE/MoaA/NifB/PqqE/SkfB family radical SAM enzyme